MLTSIEHMVKAASRQHCKVSDVVLEYEVLTSGRPRDRIVEKMHKRLSIMLLSIEKGKRLTERSPTGLSGGDAARLLSHSPVQDMLSEVLARAIAVAEYNAAMGKIVAAPTAGSAGVLPAVLSVIAEHFGATEEDTVMSLFTAAGIGMVISYRATLAGAEGGCQAECGSASAMAAGAAVELAGGDPEQVSWAVASALSAQLGLVCDPVGGLVEVPCIQRNGYAGAIALSALYLSLAGVKSHIPADEVIDAMYAVGKALPESLRETATGGLAATPTGVAIATRCTGCHPR